MIPLLITNLVSPQERIQSLNVDLKKARVYLTTLVSEQNSVYMVSHQLN